MHNYRFMKIVYSVVPTPYPIMLHPIHQVLEIKVISVLDDHVLDLRLNLISYLNKQKSSIL